MALSIQAIVCAVDFSPCCSLVCDYGVALARRTGARLYLLHAVHEPQDRLHPSAMFERGGDLTQTMADARQRMTQLMAKAALDWEAMVRFGDPVEQTLAVVDALPPCLVVSCSHGVSGLRRLLIGTVVERLSRTLECPMLVVKPVSDDGGRPEAGFGCVVVSCDGSGHWQRSASLLSLLQPDPTRPVHLVHAMEGPLEMPPDNPTVSYAQAQQALQERLTRQFNGQAHRFLPGRSNLSTWIAPGEPEALVLKVVREQQADLIVVGVRPSGRMGRLISGSTTEALLRHGPCAVLTVPEPKAASAPAGGE